MAEAAAKQTRPPGAYKDVSRAEYESWDAINQSILKVVAQKSVAHARYQKYHPKPSTPAQEFGEAVHKCVLEPRIFEEDYRRLPKFDRRTKEGKAGWAKWESENKGKVALKDDDFNRLSDMVQAVWQGPNTLAVEYLQAKGANELSLVWPALGEGDLLCKARVDRFAAVNGEGWVVDIKTARDASPKGFARAAANYGYHIQAAYYLDGLNALSPKKRRFLFLVIETEPPYPVALYEPGLAELEEGRRAYREALELWREAKVTNTWPAYPLEVQELQLPKWAFAPLPEDWTEGGF